MGVGLLRDPLVPLDFGGWFNRVFGVMGRDFRRSAAFAAVPAGVYAVGAVAIVAAMPSEATVDRRIAAATEAAERTGKPIDPSGALWLTLGPVVSVVVLFVALLFLAVALYLAGAFYLAVRAANGQPSTVAQAVGFARPRVLPLIGWYLLANLVMLVAGGVALSPGLLSGSNGLMLVGVLVWLPVLVVVMVVLGAVMMGVVVVERGGPRRAVELLRARFWPTCGRLAVATLLYMSWGGLMNVAFAPFTASLEDASVNVLMVLGAVVQGVLLAPLLMFVAAVCLVSYAELRYREDRSTNTSALAAQLTR